MTKKNFFDSDKLYNYLSSNNITDFQSFEFTFEYFSLVLGKKILYEYLKNLPESNDNQVYLSKIICNHVGFVKDREKILCYCNVGFFLDYCQRSGKYYWKKSWDFYVIFFSIIYIITLLILTLKLIKLLKTKENFYHKILRLITTPKCLVILNLEVFSLTRTLYMIIDPYGLKKIFDKPTERILNGISISSIISIYLILLLMWIGLNHVFDESKSYLQKCVNLYFYKQKKYTIIVILILIYPYQIVISYFTNSLKYQNNEFFIPIYSSILYFTFFISYIWSIKTMFTIREKLNNIYINSNKIKEHSYKKITLLDNDIKEEFEDKNEIITTRNLLKKNTKIEDNNFSYNNKQQRNNINNYNNKNNNLNNIEQESINFLELSFKNNYINEVDKCLKNKDGDENSRDLFLDYENELIKIDIYNSNSTITFDKNYKTKSNILLRKKDIKFTYYGEENLNGIQNDFLLTKEDNANISNIFLMSFLFMIVTTILSIYYLLITMYFFNIPWLLYYFIFSSSCLEILYITTVYFVFFKNKMSIEYRNLQYIGEIEKYYEKKNSYIFFDEIKYTKIYRRLKQIFKFKEENNP